MLSCYLASFNHPKPKHTLSHLLPRFRLGKHLALSWGVAKWDAGGMTDMIWHVLRKWRHSDSAFGFGENFIGIASIPVFPSRLLDKEPIDAHCRPSVPKWEQLQISRPPEFLAGVICIILCPWFCSWNPSCIFLFSQKPKEAAWIWQLEGVSFTPHMLQLLKIKLFRCQGADWTNTTYRREYSQMICIQSPHFSRVMVTMMILLVCVCRPSNDQPTKCSKASEPVRAEDAMFITFLWQGQCHGGVHFANQGVGTLWWICCILAEYDTMVSLSCHRLGVKYTSRSWRRRHRIFNTGSVDDRVSRMHWSICFEDKQALVLGNLSDHGSCSICSHVKPLPVWSNLFEDLGLEDLHQQGVWTEKISDQQNPKPKIDKTCKPQRWEVIHSKVVCLKIQVAGLS